MGEWEGWLKAGTGDDKTDIVIIADFYNRAAVYSRDRYLSSNAELGLLFGGFDNRSSNFPGRVQSFRLIPSLFFSANSPPPHSAPNVSTSPFYVRPGAVATYPDGNFFAYNFAALTPAIPAADRQSYYGSFTRDICDKYLALFADFKYTRSFFNSGLAPIPFAPDPFRDALVAIDLLGLTYREAARALRVREATVTTRLHRGRIRLARAIEDGKETSSPGVITNRERNEH